MSTKVHAGLEGVVAAATRLSLVDGEAGRLVIGGFPLEVLAPRARFEETVFLLLEGRLPDLAELTEFDAVLRGKRELPAAAAALLTDSKLGAGDPMDALRMVAATLSLAGDADERAQGMRLIAAFPVIVAAWWRRRLGLAPLNSRPDLAHAANYLWLLRGEEPTAEKERAVETYLNTVVDHGMNASTFTARVIASTRSDVVSSIVGAVGALKGPLHGGAPGPALDMVFEIGDPSNTEKYIEAKVAAGERIMGFGHRVYKVRDPRAEVLEQAAALLAASGANRELYERSREVERRVVATLDRLKPGRRLQTNVEFYTALLLHCVGLDQNLFTPTFAVGRVGGWLAHYFEQRDEDRLIRPQSIYAGPFFDCWVPIEER